MSDSAVKSRLRQAYKDAFQEIGKGITQDIQDGFDGEYGYDDNHNKVQWKELSTKYVNMKPPRGRGGSSNPILNFEGDLRAASGARIKGFIIDTDVISNKSKPRGKGSITVAEISSILDGERPHTGWSHAWSAEGDEASAVFDKHLRIAVGELREQGLWDID